MSTWTVTALAAGVVVAAAAPAALSMRTTRSASPRLRAVTYLVGMVGLVLLPLAGLACSGVALGHFLAGTAAAAVDCGPPAALGPMVGGLAVALLAALVGHAARVVAAASRTELHSVAMAQATRHGVHGGGSVWVVPADSVAAHTCGLRHPRAVVTTGLLALLDRSEQQAVCEHEAAHIRLGHPRLLLVGATIARAYRFLPPVRRAWSGLRRELEAAADDEAVRQVGTTPMLSALARIGLARASSAAGGAAAGFADGDHLRYRIARLQQPQPPGRRAGAAVAAGALALAAGFTWLACALAAGMPALVGLVVCLTALVGVGTRPAWSCPGRDATSATTPT